MRTFAAFPRSRDGGEQDRNAYALRIEPSVNDMLRAAAREEHRSIDKLVEVMIFAYYQRNGVLVKDSVKSESQVGRSE